MKRALLMLVLLGMICACGPPAPNPHAEVVLLGFADAINNQDLETARTYFAPDADVRFEGATWSVEGVDGWMDWAGTWGPYYEFSNFVIDGNDVEFDWLFREMLIDDLDCTGNVTMEGDKIASMRMTGCDYDK
jgi:hypothetical protein